jgi:hypothetical protein
VHPTKHRASNKALARLSGEDGSLVSPVGAVGKGRAGVEKVVGTDISTILHGTEMEMQVTTVHRRVAPLHVSAGHADGEEIAPGRRE